MMKTESLFFSLLTLFFLFFLVNSKEALARKFDFKTEHVSTSLSLGLTYPGIENKAYQFSSGRDTVFSKGHKVVFRNSLSLIFTFSEFLNINLGVGGIYSFVETIGYNSNSTTKRFDLKSEILVFNPTLSIEVRLFRSQFQRLYVFFGGGWGRLYLTHRYDFTSEGIRDLNLETGNTYYKEKLKSDFMSNHMGLGWESLLLDTVTLFLGAGYVHRPIKSLVFTHAKNTLFQRRVKAKERAKTHDGKDRQLSLSSFFVQMGLRFYIY